MQLELPVAEPGAGLDIKPELVPHGHQFPIVFLLEPIVSPLGLVQGKALDQVLVAGRRDQDACHRVGEQLSLRVIELVRPLLAFDRVKHPLPGPGADLRVSRLDDHILDGVASVLDIGGRFPGKRIFGESDRIHGHISRPGCMTAGALLLYW